MGNKLIAVVGMSGSGKGEVCDFLVSVGYQKIYFGQVTLDEVEKRGMPSGEASERTVREEFRARLGMAAYAILNIDRIRVAFEKGDTVIDGLYSWDELLILREEFPQLQVLCVYASPKVRKERLAVRRMRPLTAEEAEARDRAEIENSAKGGPIAVADFTIINEVNDKRRLHDAIKLILRRT